MKNRILAYTLAALMILSLLTGCAKESPNEDAVAPDVSQVPAESEAPGATEPAREDFVFTDDCGRQVEVQGEISRIVPTGPIAQIALFAIAPEMIVGLASEWDSIAKDILDAEYYNLPQIGHIYGGKGEVNLEELALLAPQLLIDIGEAKSSVAEDLDTLQEQTGITCVHIEATLETMPQVYRKLGRLLGREERGEDLAEYCQRIYDRTMDIINQVGDNRADVLYCLGPEGLNVLAKDSYHAELIDMLTNNVAVVDEPSSKGTGNEVDMEQLLLWNPDYIIFAPEVSLDSLVKEPSWQQMKAISQGNYIKVPFGPFNWMGMPPSVQRYLGLIWLPAALYPDYVDYDAYEEIAEYFRLFYHSELSRELFDELTQNSFIQK
ncbi:MAG TPA: ABC transporter substrate-binding protein [Clostridiales bacterium]|nr:ABC transporter substrate-binding protein [Clostridiales bacterium]